MDRRPILVNLDPAVETGTEYFDIDILNWVQVSKIMHEQRLGPNGALMAALNCFYENHLDEFITNILDCIFRDPALPAYFLFDCPGQVELFIQSNSPIKSIISQVINQIGFRLSVVHLLDSRQCQDSYQYVSLLCLSLTCMLQLENLPFIHVLTKVDLLDRDHLPFPLSFYQSSVNLSQHFIPYILSTQDQPLSNFSISLVQFIEDHYGLVSFSVLSIHNPKRILSLSKLIDKSNGYIYGGLSINDSILETALNVEKYDSDQEE
jgi:hypothetical protein